MKLNKRQMTLLFELISAQKPLSYEQLTNFFEVSKRTIREDTKGLNDILQQDYQIQIQYQNGKGFYLEYNQPEDLEVLKNRLSMRFSDSWEIEDSMEEYYYRILAYFFARQGYGKLDELSNMLSLNPRSISNLLKETRKKLERYRLQIDVRPHYGMKLTGRESHLRYCIMDAIYRYSSELNKNSTDNLNLFSLSEEEKMDIFQICMRHAYENEIEMSQTSLQKLVLLIAISKKRIYRGEMIHLTDDEKALYALFADKIKIHQLCEKLHRAGQGEFIDEEKTFLGIYILCHLESYHKDSRIEQMSEGVLKGLLDYLTEYGICIEGGSRNSWERGLNHVIKQAVLLDAFDIFERSPNTTMKKAVKNTALSSVIGTFCYTYLTQGNKRTMGETLYVNLCLAVYSTIRNTYNLRRRNSIAVFTPLDKSFGESLKRRVLDRYSNIIRNIEVISSADLRSDKLKSFDTLLYCGTLDSVALNTPITKLNVDYFFTEEDVHMFYEKIVVPSRMYKRAFASLTVDDYVEDYFFTSMEDMIQQHIQPNCSEEVLKQLQDFEVDEYMVVNRTLNILLFAQKEEDTFSKLLFLRNTTSVNNNKFLRIFIHSIKLDGDLIKLKTAEKVIRNLTLFKDTDNDIIFHRYYDFYDFYINNIDVPLLKTR